MDSIPLDKRLLEGMDLVTFKRVFAQQLKHMLESQVLTTEELSRALRVSNSEMRCLLDPDDLSVTVDLINRAAHCLGRRVKVKFSD